MSKRSRFKIVNKVGGGAFGEVYRGVDEVTKKEYAVKVESEHIKVPQLQIEYALYKILRHGTGIPRVFWFGKVGNCSTMVMQFLGKSIEVFFQECGNRFTLKTTLMLVDQMLRRLEYLHSKDYIHRDIKPENFVMGTNDQNARVYLIDLGLANRYFNSDTKTHIPFVKTSTIIGTIRYASFYALCGYEQGRRDDLISLAYMLVYFLKGKLPWQNVNASNKKEKIDKIANLKKECTSKQLCKGLDENIEAFVSSILSLDFNETPNYSYLHSLLKNLFFRDFENDGVFDWMISPTERKVIENSPSEFARTGVSTNPKNSAKVDFNASKFTFTFDNTNYSRMSEGDKKIDSNNVITFPSFQKTSSKSLKIKYLKSLPTTHYGPILTPLLAALSKTEKKSPGNIAGCKPSTKNLVSKTKHQSMKRNSVKDPGEEKNMLVLRFKELK